jgi:hypothetical protein
MSDPLSITAGVIAVVGFAYLSCKALNDTISSFRNAPRMLSDLRGDLDTIQDLLQSLNDALNGVENSALSADKKSCFVNLQPAIKGCQATCDGFAAKLFKITSHSNADRVSLLDRGRLQFNEKEILVLKTGLERSKQIQGLQLAMESLSLSGLNIAKGDVDAVVKILSKHSKLLEQCLKVCDSGLSETTATSSTKVRYAKVFNEAKQFIGNMGNIQLGPRTPAVAVDCAEARDKARQVVGNMSEEAAKNFWS